MNSYQESTGQYYQIAEDASPAGVDLVDADLIDFATGVPLIEETSLEALTGTVEETVVLSDNNDITPVVFAIGADDAINVDITNLGQSEVSTSLLGILALKLL